MSTDMIVKDLPRLKTGNSAMVTLYAPPGVVHLLPTPLEVKRNKIIVEAVRTTPLYIGMRVKPAFKTVYEKEGTAIIKGIAKTYADFKGTLKDDEIVWPPNDNPMIVAAVYEQSGEVVNATINYFIPVGDSHDD